MKLNRVYTIAEAAKLSGLSESTLRYYEMIGLINPIKRNPSSKHRIYLEGDINFIIAVACLSATGMSIKDMRSYLKNRDQGAVAANEQIELLELQKQRLVSEAHFLELRKCYVEAKIEFWKAVVSGDAEKIERAKISANAITKELNLSRDLKQDN